MKTHFLPSTVVTVVALACNAKADDIQLELPIQAVTVHPYTAVVSRGLATALPAGEHRLIIEGLPPNLDPARLQLSIPNDGVRLGSLDLAEVHAGGLSSAREQTLRDELESLQDDRKAVNDRIETANTELELLASLAKGGAEAGLTPTVTGNELSSIITTVGEASARARARRREAEIELREMDRQIEQKQFEMRQIATQQVTGSMVTAHLRVEESAQTMVSLIYPVTAANWRWLYEGRLDTVSRTLSLLRQAAVSQGTGEDWNNVELTLTTADQRENAVTPEIDSLFVDIYEPRPVPRSPAVAPEPAPVEEVVVTASMVKRDPAQIIASQYLVEFKIPGRITVPANRQDKILPVDEKAFAIDLVARAVPEMEPRAFLEARFIYPEETPLQAGEMQLYRDGAFIGNSQSRAFLPEQEVRMPFGVDERIRVEVRPEEEGSREGGLLSRSSVRDFRLRYEITSYHGEPVAVEVMGRVPVPRSSRIEVDIPPEATPATETDVEGEAGLLMWKLQAPSRETQEIRHYFSISYPKDTELDFENGAY